MMLAWMMERGDRRCPRHHHCPAYRLRLWPGAGLPGGVSEDTAFIVTLAGMFFARGMTSIISQEMISINNETFKSMATFKMYLPFGGYLNKKGIMIYPYIYK